MKRFPTKRRFLIVGEGRETEYNYFVGWRNAHVQELDDAATSVRVVRGRGGDACGIVKHAIKEAKNFDPKRKSGDRVFLLRDTEGVGRAPELPGAEKLAEQHGIEIVYSCPSFEFWLLCHFDGISRGHFPNCRAVIDALNKHWKTVCKTEYDKADQDVFKRVSHLLEIAQRQALDIDIHHLGAVGTALRTNPST